MSNIYEAGADASSDVLHLLHLSPHGRVSKISEKSTIFTFFLRFAMHKNMTRIYLRRKKATNKSHQADVACLDKNKISINAVFQILSTHVSQINLNGRGQCWNVQFYFRITNLRYVPYSEWSVMYNTPPQSDRSYRQLCTAESEGRKRLFHVELTWNAYGGHNLNKACSFEPLELALRNGVYIPRLFITG